MSSTCRPSQTTAFAPIAATLHPAGCAYRVQLLCKNATMLYCSTMCKKWTLHQKTGAHCNESGIVDQNAYVWKGLGGSRGSHHCWLHSAHGSQSIQRALAGRGRRWAPWQTAAPACAPPQPVSNAHALRLQQPAMQAANKRSCSPATSEAARFSCSHVNSLPAHVRTTPQQNFRLAGPRHLRLAVIHWPVSCQHTVCRAVGAQMHRSADLVLLEQ